MEKPKIAIVGIGRWGKRLADAFGKYSEVVFLVHKGATETKEWASTHFPNAISTNNLKFALNDKSVGAVVIATPINTHFEIALEALEANKHVFLEKPGTDSSEKLSRLVDEARRRNLVFQIGYEFVFADDIEEMKKMIGSGNVRRIAFDWKKMGTFDFHPVINLLVHELSILKAIGVDQINVVKYTEFEGEHKPDKVHLEAKSGEIEIFFDIDRVSELKEKSITIMTENDKFVWKDGRTQLIDREVEAFLSAIKNHTKPLVDGRFANEILETIEQIPYRS